MSSASVYTALPYTRSPVSGQNERLSPTKQSVGVARVSSVSRRSVEYGWAVLATSPSDSSVGPDHEA